MPIEFSALSRQLFGHKLCRMAGNIANNVGGLFSNNSTTRTKQKTFPFRIGRNFVVNFNLIKSIINLLFILGI